MHKAKYGNYQGKKMLYTVEEARGILSMSRNTVNSLAKECGASYKIGRSVRIDLEKLLEHINKEYCCNG